MDKPSDHFCSRLVTLVCHFSESVHASHRCGDQSIFSPEFAFWVSVERNAELLFHPLLRASAHPARAGRIGVFLRIRRPRTSRGCGNRQFLLNFFTHDLPSCCRCLRCSVQRRLAAQGFGVFSVNRGVRSWRLHPMCHFFVRIPKSSAVMCCEVR